MAADGKPFTANKTTTASPEEAIGVMAARLALVPGYFLGIQMGTTLRLQRAYWATWRIVLAVVLFPVGLLFLLGKDQEFILVSVVVGGDGSTRVAASGRAIPMMAGSVHAALNSLPA